jgi:hypothetical protein
MAECRTCKHFEAQPFDDGDIQMGFCVYSLPPVLRQLFDALTCEPATHIDYNNMLYNGNRKVSADYGCSEHMPHPPSPDQLTGADND